MNEDVRNDYFNDFGYATITVTEAFPGNTTWKLYENVPEEYVDKLNTQSPILIFDAWQDTYSFGVMEVSVYVQ
jgi:hypothetical protein